MTTPNFGSFCWNELATPNLKAAQDFYGKLLGWTFKEHQMDGHTYCMIFAEDKEFAGMWQIPSDQLNSVPPNWMGYILVKDIEETRKQAESLGATVKLPVTQAGDFGKYMLLVDPTGAHIAFWQALNQ